MTRVNGQRNAGEVLGFRQVCDGTSSALVRVGGPDEVVAALLDGEGCQPLAAAGRGTVEGFAWADGRGVLRKYRRGGLVRHLLSDRYLLRNRPLQELRVHEFAYRHGLSVPEPQGARWTRIGPLFGGAFATRELRGRTLFEYLSAAPRYPEDTLQRVGMLVRKMHDLGIYHADLQVKNVFLGVDRLYLLDFDNARVVERVSRWQRARNLLRFRRSLEKNYLPVRFFGHVMEGYGMRLPWYLDWLYRVKGIASDALSGRASRRG